MLGHIITQLNSWPTECVFLLECASYVCFLYVLLKYFQLTGVYVFMVIVSVIANIQVLKVVEYGFYPTPIALGKVPICFTFLASDLLTEIYGKKRAYRGLYISLITNFSMVYFMMLTVGYAPVVDQSVFSLHQPIEQIFVPMPGIFIASLIAFFLSQRLDIYIFVLMKEVYQIPLMVRSWLSTTISAFIDNIIFYTLAFYVFHPNPSDYQTVIWTYIIGTYLFRMLIISFNTTLIGFLKKAPSEVA